MGCILYDGEDATVLVDPLLPAGDDGFLDRLDAHVRNRRLPVSILTTIKWHRRSRDELADRYAARTSRAKAVLPAGLESVSIRGAGETMFWLPAPRALVPGDRLLGALGGGLRLCPESWLGYLSSGLSRKDLAARLRPLLDLPIESVLTSHGEPAMRDGHAALADALERA